MFSSEKLINQAKAKGFKFNAFSCAFNRFGDTYFKDHQRTYFSFTADDKNWFEFSGYSFDHTDKLFFDFKYFSGSGTTQRTFRKELQALKLLGINY